MLSLGYKQYRKYLFLKKYNDMERNKRDRMVYKDNCWVHTVQSRQSCENFNAKSMHVK